MQVKYKNQSYTLAKKDRTIESEAPAIRVKMFNDETKVIGMMAPSIQVMITLNNIKDYSEKLDEILKENPYKIIAYIITASMNEEIKEIVKTYGINEGFISNEFKDFSLKFGININETLIANSLFIIDKEGVIKYKQIPSTLENSFDFDDFKENLEETINFKPKGHTHENWMGV